MKRGWDLNTATWRQHSADAVGLLGMLGKYTDAVGKPVVHCFTEAGLCLRLDYGHRVSQTLLSLHEPLVGCGKDSIYLDGHVEVRTGNLELRTKTSTLSASYFLKKSPLIGNYCKRKIICKGKYNKKRQNCQNLDEV